jgi:ferredoxin
MKVTVDRNLCGAAALCTGLAPEVFDLAEDGTLLILVEEPDEALADSVEDAVRSCPLAALTLTKD